MFSCEFYEIFNITFFTDHLWTTASVRDLHEIVNLLQMHRCDDFRHCDMGDLIILISFAFTVV